MRRLSNHIELLVLFNIIYAITPPQDGQIPHKYQEYFKNNNIGKDYGNSAWQYRLHSKQLGRSTEVDSFFIPVIMANYTDFSGTISSAIYKEHLFGNNSTGSFSDYYKEVSYGKFYPIGDVYGWYNTTKSKSQAAEDPRSFVVSALEFSDNDIDMTKVESRPSSTGLWEYIFFIDFAGHVGEPAVARALTEIEGQAAMFKVLGSYPKSS